MKKIKPSMELKCPVHPAHLYTKAEYAKLNDHTRPWGANQIKYEKVHYIKVNGTELIYDPKLTYKLTESEKKNTEIYLVANTEYIDDPNMDIKAIGVLTRILRKQQLSPLYNPAYEDFAGMFTDDVETIQRSFEFIMECGYGYKRRAIGGRTPYQYFFFATKKECETALAKHKKKLDEESEG